MIQKIDNLIQKVVQKKKVRAHGTRISNAPKE